MRFQATIGRTAGGLDRIDLRDEAAGASASILPAAGFNLFDLRLPLAGAVRPVIAAAEGWADHPDRPSRHGIPVLFPFPNRCRDAAYSWGGRTYRLPPNRPPHAIHGFAFETAWTDVDLGADERGAWAEGRFRIGRDADPEARAGWPADGSLTLRYTLLGKSLRIDVEITNEDDRPLPWGFGLHAYFRLPFGPGGDPARARVIVPARSWWVLEDGLPTGERRSVAGTALDYRDGRFMAGLEADDVLTDLEPDGDGWTTCRLVDEGLGAEVRLRSDPSVREVVVFTPPARPGVVAVEPYTMATDAMNLEARGIAAGLRVLAPGASERFALAIQAVD